jgi:hypothetical protein
MYLVIYPWMGKDNFLTFEQFVNKSKTSKKEQTPEDMLTTIKFLNAAFGGEVVELG